MIEFYNTAYNEEVNVLWAHDFLLHSVFELHFEKFISFVCNRGYSKIHANHA